MKSEDLDEVLREVRQIEPGDELLDGVLLKILRDPNDPRFDLIVLRRIGNEIQGGAPRPVGEWTGMHAVRRWVRLIVGETMGHVSDKRIRWALEQLHRDWEDPS